MPSKGVQDRVLACAPTMWAATAFSEFVDEAIRRLWPDFVARLVEAGDGEPRTGADRRLSVSRVMYGAGLALGNARDRMVDADRFRERQRAVLEEDRRRSSRRTAGGATSG